MSTAGVVLLVKRKRQTIFVSCDIEGGDKPRVIKAILERATAVPADRLRLWVDQTPMDRRPQQPPQPTKNRTILDDDITLSAQGVKADQQLFMVFRQDNGAWEEVNVAPYEED